MTIIEPINQIRLFGLKKYFSEMIYLYENNKLPNKRNVRNDATFNTYSIGFCYR